MEETRTFSVVFQLTPSRRATNASVLIDWLAIISTHALTEGDAYDYVTVPENAISTHALTEGDSQCIYICAVTVYFNSRPHGGRQREGQKQGRIGDFNSRPHGGRQNRVYTEIPEAAFQLTPSRRATTIPSASLKLSIISTHALTEGDV